MVRHPLSPLETRQEAAPMLYGSGRVEARLLRFLRGGSGRLDPRSMSVSLDADAGAPHRLGGSSLYSRPASTKHSGDRPLGLFLRVLELRQGLDGLLGRSRQNEFVILKLDLLDGDGHVVAPEAHKAARADDGEGHCAVRGDDEIVDPPYLLVALVVDGLAQNLLLHAPAHGHDLELLHGNSEPGRPGRLRPRVLSGNEREHTRHEEDVDDLHDGLLWWSGWRSRAAAPSALCLAIGERKGDAMDVAGKVLPPVRYAGRASDVATDSRADIDFMKLES